MTRTLSNAAGAEVPDQARAATRSVEDRMMAELSGQERAELERLTRRIMDTLGLRTGIRAQSPR